MVDLSAPAGAGVPVPQPAPAPAPAPVTVALTSYGELAGRWRRSLIAFADGTQDATTIVDWLQARTCFVDLRQPIGRPDFTGVRCLADVQEPQFEWLSRQEGFAGVTRHGFDAGGDYLEWIRTVDFTPADTPDAGRLRYSGDDIDTLIESGLAGEYVEYWHRDAVTSGPSWGRLLSGIAPSGEFSGIPPSAELNAVLVRVGSIFGFARSRAKTLPAGVRLPQLVQDAAAPSYVLDLVDCEISLGVVDGKAWTITRSSMPYREGAELAVEFQDGPLGHVVWTADVDRDGGPIRRCWSVYFEERLGAPAQPI